MDPVSSRGSQLPSPTAESDVSPPVLTPKEAAAKTPANASAVSTNKVQSYVTAASVPPESMCRATPPPFSRSEPQGEELKLLEQVRHQQAAASMGRGVELCKNLVEVPVARELGLLHHWLRTSTREAGMGPNDGSVPGEKPTVMTPYLGPTRLNDHTGRGNKPGSTCVRQENVDEACINRELAQQGKLLGPWTTSNNCQTYAAQVLKQCSTEPQPPPTPMFDPGKI